LRRTSVPRGPEASAVTTNGAIVEAGAGSHEGDRRLRSARPRPSGSSRPLPGVERTKAMGHPNTAATDFQLTLLGKPAADLVREGGVENRSRNQLTCRFAGQDRFGGDEETRCGTLRDVVTLRLSDKSLALQCTQDRPLEVIPAALRRSCLPERPASRPSSVTPWSDPPPRRSAGMDHEASFFEPGDDGAYDT